MKYLWLQVLKTTGQTLQSMAPGTGNYNNNMYPTQTPSYAGVLFRKAHRGTFLGFVLMAGMFIAMILFFFTESSGSSEQAQLIYLTSDIILHFFVVCAVVFGTYQMSKLSFAPKGLTIDDTLLLLAMSGSFFFEMSLMISTSTYLSNSNHSSHEDYIIILSLVSALLAGTHTILQLLLVLGGLRLYSATKENLKEMPGRGTITFLIIGNITLWVFRTIQVKEIEMGIQEDFYGTLAWLFIMNLCLPLQLFFFFHSSVCFADIWSQAYKPIQPQYHLVHHGESSPAAGSGGMVNPAFTRMDSISEHYDEDIVEENRL